MDNKIELQPEYLLALKKILSTHLPPQAKVWLFGSRARGTAKKFSDIDLLIDYAGNLSTTLPLETLAKLQLVFEESDLPYKVDLADAAAISAAFRKSIEAELILLIN